MARRAFGQKRLCQAQKNKATADNSPTKTAEKITFHADAYPALAIYCCHAG
jgi:hypothetical protein